MGARWVGSWCCSHFQNKSSMDRGVCQREFLNRQLTSTEDGVNLSTLAHANYRLYLTVALLARPAFRRDATIDRKCDQWLHHYSELPARNTRASSANPATIVL